MLPNEARNIWKLILIFDYLLSWAFQSSKCFNLIFPVSYLLTVGSFDFEIDDDGSANAFPGDEVLLLSLDAEYPLPDCLAELPSFPETIFGSASGLIYPGKYWARLLSFLDF